MPNKVVDPDPLAGWVVTNFLWFLVTEMPLRGALSFLLDIDARWDYIYQASVLLLNASNLKNPRKMEY